MDTKEVISEDERDGYLLRTEKSLMPSIDTAMIHGDYNEDSEALMDSLESFGGQVVTVVSAYSRHDMSYIGNEEFAEMLTGKYGLRQIQALPGNKVASIGFNENEQKWYGWSHRAIFGFGVGSHVKLGDCAFVASNKEEFLADTQKFWADFHICEAKPEGVMRYDKDTGKAAQPLLSSALVPWPKKWGRGEWTAKTLEDAKQMAMDFAEGVS